MRLLDDQEQGCSQREAEEERRFTVREPIRSLKFDDVRFRYPTQPSTEILRGFALEIQAGTSVAFVGPSGGGKSTAVALLARFYDPSILLTNKLCYDNPTAGRVVVNGKYSLRDLPLRTWRGRIGYVGQEPVLFNISARDNILLGMQKDEVSEVEKDFLWDFAGLNCASRMNSASRMMWRTSSFRSYYVFEKECDLLLDHRSLRRISQEEPHFQYHATIGASNPQIAFHVALTSQNHSIVFLHTLNKSVKTGRHPPRR